MNKQPTEAGAQSPRWTLTGRILSGLAILFLVMDAGMKLAHLPEVIQTMQQMGWPTDTTSLNTLALILLVSTLLYLMPRTALLGAVLITGYLGGAIASHLRIGSPLFSHVLFGVYVGAVVWAGLWLRNPALRSLMPAAR